MGRTSDLLEKKKKEQERQTASGMERSGGNVLPATSSGSRTQKMLAEKGIAPTAAAAPTTTTQRTPVVDSSITIPDDFSTITDQSVEKYLEWAQGQAIQNNWTDEQFAEALGGRTRQQEAALATERANEMDKFNTPSTSRLTPKARQKQQDNRHSGKYNGVDRAALAQGQRDALADFGNRVKNTVTGGAKNVASGYTGAAAMLERLWGDAAGALNNVLPDGMKRTEFEQGTKELAQQYGDTTNRISESAQKDLDTAKEGLGLLGRAAVDAGASGVGMLSDAALGGVGGISNLVGMGIRTFGNAAQEANNDGLSTGRQFAAGTLNAAKEVAMELMFDGLAGIYGGGAADDIVEDVILRFTKNETAQGALMLAASALGESAEEIVADILDPIIKTIYNRKSLGENWSDFSVKDTLYDGLVGGIAALATSGGSNVVNGILGTDTQQATGAQTQQDTDTTSPVATDTRKAYSEGNLTSAETSGAERRQTPEKSIEQMNAAAVQRFASTLGKAGGKTLTDFYDGTSDAADYIRGMVSAYNAGKASENGEPFNLKSGNSSVRPSQRQAAFIAGTADARTENRAAQRGLVRDETFKRANLSSKDARTLDALANALGVKISFADAVTSENGRPSNAKYENGAITLSLGAKDAVMTTVKHEVVHRIREASPEAYATLEEFVRGNMSEALFDYNLKERSAAYGTTDADTLTEETVADAFGRLVEDNALREKFVTENRTLAQRVSDAITDIINAIKRMLNGQNRRLSDNQLAEFAELRDSLIAINGLFTDAIKAVGNSTADVDNARYSIQATTENRLFVNVDGDILSNVPENEWVRTVKNNLKQKFPDGVTVGSSEIKIDKQSRKEMTYSKYMQWLRDNDRQTYSDKLRATNNADEILQATTGWIDEGLNHPRNDKITDFASGEVLMRIGQNDYTARVVVGTEANGSMKLYDVLGLTPTSFTAKETGAAKTAYPSPSTGRNTATVSTDSILRGSEKGNSKNSLSSRETLDAYIAEHGAIPKGEKPSRDVTMPKRTAENQRLSQTVRTVLEAEATLDEIVPNIEALAAKGSFSYDAYSDKAAITDAENTIRSKGWGQSLADWTKEVEKGTVSKTNTALGWALYNNAANTGDTKTALSILNNMIEHQRNAAQAVQATRILKQLSPETQLYSVQQSVAGLQEELNKRYGKKSAPTLKINETLAERYMRAKTQEARDAALRDIYRDIGRQMPTRFVDRWNAWRYLSMLGNVRTHVRNIVGNAGFAPVVTAKDLTATAIESAVSRVGGGKLDRTKGFVGLGKKDRALLGAAWSDYANIQEQALGGGKYNDFANANKYVEEGRRIFGNTRSAAWNKTGGAVLEAVRNFNGAALDAEDAWFSRPHYAAALAQYCKANGITAADIKGGAGIETARAYAIREAQKATYRDTNALSQTISGLGRVMGPNDNIVRKGVSTLMEGILPFRKTPANILARGLEYSPAGLLKSLTYDLHQVQQGKMTGADAIDHISAGLTGTGLLTLGIYLAAEGLVRGHGSGDDKENDMEELTGHQAYALELPNGTSVTLDWLAPECLPFFVGVNLWEQTQGDIGGATLSDLLTAASTVSEPLLEMSCLQSLNDIFDAVGYASNTGVSGLTSALASATTSYLTQALPTILGQAERTGENLRYATYTERNGFLTSDMQYTLGRASARLPGWDFQQIPYIDAWGRMEETGSAGQRTFNNFINPAYTSTVEGSATEKELLRLYRETDEAGVLPKRAAKHFTVDGKRKDLTAEEYVAYAMRKGRLSRELIDDLVNSKEYKAMSDAEKVKAIQNAYDYANQTAKAAVSDYSGEKWTEKTDEAQKKYGISPDTYITLKTKAAGVTSIKDKDGKTIANSESLRKMQLVYQTPGLTDVQRQAMFEYLGVGKTVRHYNKAKVAEELAEMEKQAGK